MQVFHGAKVRDELSLMLYTFSLILNPMWRDCLDHPGSSWIIIMLNYECVQQQMPG